MWGAGDKLKPAAATLCFVEPQHAHICNCPLHPAGTLSAALAAAATQDDSSSTGSLHGPSSGLSPQSTFVAGMDGLRGLAATCSELEQVLFAQQLILFAPDAVPPTKHLPLLLLTLSSSRPTLRKAAAATLWHLADRNAVALAQVRALLSCSRPAKESFCILWSSHNVLQDQHVDMVPPGAVVFMLNCCCMLVHWGRCQPLFAVSVGTFTGAYRGSSARST